MRSLESLAIYSLQYHMPRLVVSSDAHLGKTSPFEIRCKDLRYTTDSDMRRVEIETMERPMAGGWSNKKVTGRMRRGTWDRHETSKPRFPKFDEKSDVVESLIGALRKARRARYEFSSILHQDQSNHRAKGPCRSVGTTKPLLDERRIFSGLPRPYLLELASSIEVGNPTNGNRRRKSHGYRIRSAILGHHP